MYMRMKDQVTSRFDYRYFEKPRIGYILGTGWYDAEVMETNGFVCEKEISFASLGINVKSGSGHKNVFKFGTWHGRDVVISCGRVHLFQDQGRFGHASLIRQWMTWFITFMNGSKRVVITSAVGGLSERIMDDMLVMPTGIVSAHLGAPYLIGSNGEFVMSESLLWPYEPGEKLENINPGTNEPIPRVHASKLFIKGVKRTFTFVSAAKAADCEIFLDGKHYVVPGPAFCGATERRLYANWRMDTIGMSLKPELDLIALENSDNRLEGATGVCEETDIRVLPALFVSDNHDIPNNNEIQDRAKAMSPKFGKFLSFVAQSEW